MVNISYIYTSAVRHITVHCNKFVLYDICNFWKWLQTLVKFIHLQCAILQCTPVTAVAIRRLNPWIIYPALGHSAMWSLMLHYLDYLLQELWWLYCWLNHIEKKFTMKLAKDINTETLSAGHDQESKKVTKSQCTNINSEYKCFKGQKIKSKSSAKQLSLFLDSF